MKKLLIFFILFTTSTFCLYSQNRTIQGKVISEYFENLAGVTIMVSDSIEVGRTDLGGFFQIEIPISIKEILIGSVGIDPTTIMLTDECDNIEVVMMLTYTNDFITLKRAEKKREKRFKKLTKKHREAFEKGIFETECACYIRKFEPYYLAD